MATASDQLALLEQQKADAVTHNQSVSAQISALEAQMVSANPALANGGLSDFIAANPFYGTLTADLNASFSQIQTLNSQIAVLNQQVTSTQQPNSTIVDSSANGYVATPSDPATTTDVPAANPEVVSPPYTSDTSPNYNVVGGYDPNAIGSTGGGFDPNNPSYGNQSNSIGGDVAITQNYTGAPSFAGGWYGDQTEPSGGGADPTVAGLADPTNARPGSKIAGGAIGDPAASPSVAFQSAGGANGATSPAESDWRVRISLADNAKIFYKAGSTSAQNQLMQPLIETNGVIFPYTPTISITHAANYNPVSPTHSNYPMQFYNNSEVSDIQISGEFTVQSVDEGKYLMAAIYFFRSATKMFFGTGDNVGNPPPIVFLDGYGSHYFPHVPCVISAFTHTLANDVDYIEIPITSTTLSTVNVQNDNLNIGSVQLTAQQQQYVPSLLQSSTQATTAATQAIVQSAKTTKSQFQNITTNTRVPTSSTIAITLKPIYSRKNLHDRFNLNKFAAGQLLQDKTKGYGGFL